MTAIEILSALWADAALPRTALEMIRLTGSEPVLPSSFAVGTAAQVSIGAAALAAAELWRLRTGRAQQVSVEMRDAAVDFVVNIICA
jgi:crotonobetainyl-CoA:carnitine CoA-transferase CaiB-like acyl-CoA transferase